MLELAVLGLLAEQPLHGYELKKRLSETLGPLWGISFGSLYPALRRLERVGRDRGDRGAGADPAAAIVPTGSLDGDLAAARLRRRRPPGPAHPQGVPDHRRGPGAVRRAPHRRRHRRRAHLRAEALVLPVPRRRRPPRVPRAPPRPARPQRLAQGAPRPEPDHRSLHPVAPRAPGPFHPTRSRVDRRADRRRAREPGRRTHRRSSIRMSGPPHQPGRPSESRSPASATARAASCRASSSTATRIRTSASPA